MTRFLLGCAVMLLVGCPSGTPEEGDRCDDEDTAVCSEDGKNQLVCQDGKLKEFPCKGAGGCTSNGDVVRCDTDRNVAGDECPDVNDGKAQCTEADPNVRLTCRDGILVSESCPGGCAVANDMVECRRF